MTSRSYNHSRTVLTSSQGSPSPYPSSSSSLKRKFTIPSSQESTYLPSSSRKRKVSSYVEEDGYASDDEFATSRAQDALAGISSSPPAKKRDIPKKERKAEEKRLKRFRQKPPQSYLDRLLRVRTQRMFLIDRNRSMRADGMNEEEVFDIVGSTGNIYEVKIGRVPKCSCPDARNGNQCKHIIYVLVNVLKAPSNLAYQLAFLTTELSQIFSNAPSTPQSSSSDKASASASTDTGGSRKPIEGDCPVCVMEFDPSDKTEEIVWCKAACGNNIHKHCFEQWARSKPGPVKCVFCRSLWKGDEGMVKRVSKVGRKNAEGYVNVASQLGISGQRDMSSYYRPWVDRRFGGWHM